MPTQQFRSRIIFMNFNIPSK